MHVKACNRRQPRSASTSLIGARASKCLCSLHFTVWVLLYLYPARPALPRPFISLSMDTPEINILLLGDEDVGKSTFLS